MKTIKMKTIKMKKSSGPTEIQGVKNSSIIEVKRVPINSIKPWKKNPRKNDKAVKPLAELLQKHGQKTPIVVWIKDNQIYKGNTTYKAAKYLKWDSIWVAFADFPSYKEAVGYALADNKASEWSDWDDSILSMLLPEAMGKDMNEIAGLTGFKEKDLAGFFAADSNELPDELKEIDIEGMSFEEKADYLVIQFPDHKTMDTFKEKFKSKTAHPRVITYEMLMEVMDWRESVGSGRVMKKKLMKRRV